jgi:putative FmdB family regulatory protein
MGGLAARRHQQLTPILAVMPLYEYRCRDCDTVFEARRQILEADAPLRCPDGHERVTRLLSVFATTGRAASAPAHSSAPCGPACACHPG